MLETQTHIVIDNGSAYIKAGLSGEEGPRAVFPNLLGKLKVFGSLLGPEIKDLYLGQEALEKRSLLKLAAPVKNGFIVNWDDMEKLWHHTFYNELRISPEDHFVTLSDPPQNTPENREKMCEIMFENFNTPGFYINNHPSLILISQGSTSGVVIDSGHNMTRITPIYESYCLRHTMIEMRIGGKDLTDYMCSLLEDMQIYYNNIIDMEIVKDIKERMGYVSIDYDGEIRNMTDNLMCSHVKYKLPDGTLLPMSVNRIKCTEALTFVRSYTET